MYVLRRIVALRLCAVQLTDDVIPTYLHLSVVHSFSLVKLAIHLAYPSCPIVCQEHWYMNIADAGRRNRVLSSAIRF